MGWLARVGHAAWLWTCNALAAALILPLCAGCDPVTHPSGGKRIAESVDCWEASADPAATHLIRDIRIHYTQSAEGFSHDILIENGTVTYTTLAPFDIASRQTQRHPAASEPLYTSDDFIEKKARLTAEELAALSKLLHDIKFLALKDAYGKTLGGRSYDTLFEVMLDGNQKKAVYHSSPDAEPMPAELTKLREALLRLVKERISIDE